MNINTRNSKVLKIIYRFLKEYNIAVEEYAMSKLLGSYSPSASIAIDVFIVNYLTFYENIRDIPYTTKSILDFLWCTFLLENYDNIKKITDKETHFILRSQEELNSITNRLNGKNYFAEQNKISKKMQIFLF